MDINFLFCNHPLYPYRVDMDYEEEYQAAGIDHTCALFSYEDMQVGKLSLYGEEISGLTIYRGWMMTPEMYRNFYDALEKRGVILINSPQEYDKYHLLPGWYKDFETETAKSVWSTTNEIKDAMSLTKGLKGSFIVKDFVKSRKHEWYDACFIKNIQNEEDASKIIGNFIERQADCLVGGIVLRKYEMLKQIGFHENTGIPLSEEYRVFVYAGRILAIDDYWTDKKEVSLTHEEYIWVESIAKRIQSNFVTVDLARKEDGSLIIVEFGDGQVSGLQQLKGEEFYRAFRGQDIHNPYSIEDIKRIITIFVSNDIEPEMRLKLRGKKSEYMIIGYSGHVSFQRCGESDASGEYDYEDLDSLFEAELIDGICLNHDWYKVSDIWCEPDMEDIEAVIEGYRVAAEKRNEVLGDRHQIYRIVKVEIDKWNPYSLLPYAPHDEFNGESEEIARHIKLTSSVGQIARAISKVFSRSFEAPGFMPEDCMTVADAIRKSLDRKFGD
ncbi:MAG: ATP-grasp domain-containing protein [Roseburia sp.]|nr:ATP-grasp domain-containing protein [Roseburia sp.]